MAARGEKFFAATVNTLSRIGPCLRMALPLVVLFFSPIAQADEPELLQHLQEAKRRGAQITDEMVNDIMDKFRVRQRELKSDPEYELSLAEGNLLAERKILSHLTGKEGVPLPSSEESVWMPAPTPDPTAVYASLPTPLPTPTPYQRPFICSKNETRREVYEKSVEAERMLVDILFIPENLIPLEPTEVFGTRVSVVPYGPNESGASFTRMEIYSVPCLPYRVRWTNTTRYFDSGLNAYRNYDKEPAGRGTLHPIMSKALSDKSPSIRHR
jgi:hypothetical protein